MTEYYDPEPVVEEEQPAEEAPGGPNAIGNWVHPADKNMDGVSQEDIDSWPGND